MDCLEGQPNVNKHKLNMSDRKSEARNLNILTEDDIPGVKLPRDSVEKCSVVQLKRWLLCRGAKTTGIKKALVSRLVHALVPALH